MLRSHPHAVFARYHAAEAMLAIVLSTGGELRLPVAGIQGLAGATAADLGEIEVSPAGCGLHFPRLDADLHVPDLIAGVLGSQAWSARRLGSAGGSARSDRKVTPA